MIRSVFRYPVPPLVCTLLGCGLLAGCGAGTGEIGVGGIGVGGNAGARRDSREAASSRPMQVVRTPIPLPPLPLPPLRNFASFLDLPAISTTFPERLPSTRKPNLGVAGKSTIAVAAPRPGEPDLGFDLQIAQEIGARLGDSARDVIDVRFRHKVPASAPTLSGRLLLWVPKKVTGSGWSDVAVAGTLGTPVAGSALVVGNAVAAKDDSRAQWVSLAAPVRAGLAALSASDRPELVFEDARHPTGDARRYVRVVTLKPRPAAFAQPRFDWRYLGASAFAWQPDAAAGGRVVTRAFYARDVPVASGGYRGSITESRRTQLPDGGGAFDATATFDGVVARGQDPSSPAVVGHWVPRTLTVTNAGVVPLPVKFHSVRVSKGGAILSERTFFQGTLAPGRAQAVPVAGLESPTPADPAPGAEGDFHTVLVEAAGEQAALFVLGQRFLGPPVGRGFTFPF